VGSGCGLGGLRRTLSRTLPARAGTLAPTRCNHGRTATPSARRLSRRPSASRLPIRSRMGSSPSTGCQRSFCRTPTTNKTTGPPDLEGPVGSCRRELNAIRGTRDKVLSSRSVRVCYERRWRGAAKNQCSELRALQNLRFKDSTQNIVWVTPEGGGVFDVSDNERRRTGLRAFRQPGDFRYVRASGVRGRLQGESSDGCV
jgi:hypothetical protein